MAVGYVLFISGLVYCMITLQYEAGTLIAMGIAILTVLIFNYNLTNTIEKAVKKPEVFKKTYMVASGDARFCSYFVFWGWAGRGPNLGDSIVGCFDDTPGRKLIAGKTTYSSGYLTSGVCFNEIKKFSCLSFCHFFW